MPFKMKTSLLVVFTNLLIFSYYWLGVDSLTSHQTIDENALIGLVIKSIFACGIVFIVLMIITAAVNHKDALQRDDERDKLITLHGDQAGYIGLSIVITILFIWWWSHQLTSVPFAIESVSDSVNFIHLLFIGFLVADCAKHIRQAWLYHKGC